MNLNEAYKIVRADMDKHGLTGWKLVWMDKKTVAGTTQYLYWSENTHLSRGIISISRPFFELFNEEQAKETGLHEIAHALDKPKNKSHGPEWKKIALRIGSNGERCVSIDEPKPAGRYRGSCPQGHVYTKHKGLQAMIDGQYFCTKCQKKSGLDRFIVWVDTTTNKVITSTKTEPVVSIMTQTKKPVPKVETRKPVTKAAPSWKDRYDQGMTSFGDDW